jgi:hypothetical protein
MGWWTVTGRRVLVGWKNEPLARLARIDTEDSRKRYAHGSRDTTEAGIEADLVVGQFQPARRGVADIQDDAAVLHVLLWHGNTCLGSVHDEVRRLPVVSHPLVEGPQQVRPLRRGYCRISVSASVRLSRNVGRAKMPSMYLRIGWAPLPLSSMPYTGSRQSNGATLASTSENSSLRK